MKTNVFVNFISKIISCKYIRHEKSTAICKYISKSKELNIDRWVFQVYEKFKVSTLFEIE